MQLLQGVLVLLGALPCFPEFPTVYIWEDGRIVTSYKKFLPACLPNPPLPVAADKLLRGWQEDSCSSCTSKFTILQQGNGHSFLDGRYRGMLFQHWICSSWLKSTGPRLSSCSCATRPYLPRFPSGDSLSHLRSQVSVPAAW
jgi:hypothetical protein